MGAPAYAPRVLIRPVRKDDWALIYSSWKRNNWRRSAPAGQYYPRMQHRIDECVRRGAEVRVACDPEDEDFILGWCCYEDDALHYLYVRQSARPFGVVRPALLSGLTLTRASHRIKHHPDLPLDQQLSKELDP